MSSAEVIHAINYGTVIQEYYAPMKQNWRAGKQSEASTVHQNLKIWQIRMCQHEKTVNT